MAAPATTALRYTLNFALTPDDGWSETYYSLGSSIDAAAVARAHDLALKRAVPLISLAKISSCRISVSPANRTSRLVKFLNQRGDPSGPQNRDVGAVTTEIALYSTTGHRRDAQFHGQADDNHAYDLNGDQTSSLSNGLKTFLDYLIANSWQMRVESKTASDNTNIPISNIIVVGNKVQFLTSAIVNPLGQFLVSGIKGYKVSQFRGTWTVSKFIPAVAPSTDNTLECSTTRLIDPNYFIAKQGNIRILGPTFWNFEPIVAYDPTAGTFSTRRIGRPPSQRRGRRSGKR